LGQVVEISYCGYEPVEGRNLSRLVGWHEWYLNSACFTYECGQISDWISFFHEPWATIIYHDNFTSFASLLKDSLQYDKGMFLLQDRILEVAESCKDDAILSLERRKILGNRGENVPSVTKSSIESHALEYLRKNRSSFNGIFIPPVGGVKFEPNEAGLQHNNHK
jgi:hypothetical protein